MFIYKYIHINRVGCTLAEQKTKQSSRKSDFCYVAIVLITLVQTLKVKKNKICKF